MAFLVCDVDLDVDDVDLDLLAEQRLSGGLRSSRSECRKREHQGQRGESTELCQGIVSFQRPGALAWTSPTCRVRVRNEATAERIVKLGGNLASGEQPQAIVPVRAWQAAKSLGDWTLAGCTVAPGFEFSGFELAPEGWSPG